MAVVRVWTCPFSGVPQLSANKEKSLPKLDVLPSSGKKVGGGTSHLGRFDEADLNRWDCSNGPTK